MDIRPCCILHLPVRDEIKKNVKTHYHTRWHCIPKPLQSTKCFTGTNFSSTVKVEEIQSSFSHLFFCSFFGVRVHPAHILQTVLESPFDFRDHILSLRHKAERGKSEPRPDVHDVTQGKRLLRGRHFQTLTMVLLSSVKVALTKSAPRAKPRALSVSLTHSFQRGVQLWNTK